jgi:hypothetical protein
VSDWTSWLIIIAVVALAVGPVMMFQPSGNQRRLASFRAAANRQGLRVRLAGGNVSELKGTALYALPWRLKKLRSEHWSLVRKSYQHELHLLGFWAWTGAENPRVRQLMLARLVELPVSVMGVSAGPEGLGVNWTEQGPAAELDGLIVWLTSVQDELAAIRR